MGTPGDKAAKIGEVVKQEPVEPTEQPQAAEADLPVAAAAASVPPFPPAMGVQSVLPHFETFGPGLGLKQDPGTALVGIEQGQLEFYFPHSKYYPSASETLSVYPAASKPAPTPRHVAIVNPEEAGPSGIQTPKSTSRSTSASPGKLKKNKKQPAASPSTPTPKKSHACGVCQKNYASSAKLAKHQQTHACSSPFKCDTCKKVFVSKFKLVRHKLIHSDSKPFVCQVCERTFHRKDHLKNHSKVHSPSKEIYACEKPDCKKEYTSLMSYRKHLAIHEAEAGNLTCAICSKTFETKDEIVYHLKIHSGSRTVKNPDEKKCTCDYCDRKFFTKKDVRRHLVVHTGMRNFLCQYCPQRFGRKDHLVRHIKKSHARDVKDEQQTAKSEKKELPETVTKPKTEVKIESCNTSEFPLEYIDIDETLFIEPSTSNPAELTDLGPIVLEDEIADDDDAALADVPVPVPNVLDESVVARLLDSADDDNTPLPSFSKTFQPPPT